MKTFRNLLALSCAIAVSAGAFAARPLAGPKGGRILTEAAPHAEFFVDAQRPVVISFYDAELKPVSASGQVATATAEAPTGKVQLEFAPRDGALFSTAPLPDGDGYRIVVQIRATANAKPSNHRVTFHDEECADCHRAEYACVCDDAGDHGDHGHAH